MTPTPPTPSPDSPPPPPQERLQTFLAKTISGTFGFKILNVLLVYGNSLLIARLIGATGYGEYIYTISWLQILLIPAALGFEGLMNREIAVYVAQEQWALVKGILVAGNWLVGVASVAVAVGAGVALYALGALNTLTELWTFWLGLLLLPILALSRLRSYALKGFHRVLMGEFPESIIRPLGLIVPLALLFFLRPQDLGARQVMAIEGLATTLAFIVGTVFLARSLPAAIATATPEIRLKGWIRQALPMLLIGGMYVVNQQTDSVMLGLLRDSEQVGVYAVVNRGAGLLGFVQVAFSGPLAAIFASLNAQGDRGKLQSLVTRTCQASFAISLGLALGLLLLADPFLLLFGPEFLPGKSALFILVVSQLFNTLTGAVAMLLIMTGFDGKVAISVATSAFVNIALNGLLIPGYGVAGAAIATGVSIIIWNAMMVYFAQRMLGVRSLPF